MSTFPLQVSSRGGVGGGAGGAGTGAAELAAGGLLAGGVSELRLHDGNVAATTSARPRKRTVRCGRDW
ncbi:MAG TPA: hypothetical protein VM791_00210 [Vicinamibacterales bacterium]|nr:hypothetical protein [Vicinamibacterales bacterium]